MYFAGTDSPDLQTVIAAETTLQWDVHPTEHENYGRGMVYLRNNTGFHMSCPFMSDSDVVPLYDGIAKAEKYGYPLEDRTDKFPASNGIVQVDSEKILYTGIAGWSENKRVTADLEWLPGRVLCRAGDGVNTPAGTPTDFARSRGDGSPHAHGNNYFLQVVPASAYSSGAYVTAVRIWLKKVNYPEDGVTVSINAGSVSNSAAAVALVNNVKAYGAMAPGARLSADGGWVTFYFDSFYLAPGTEYWIMIRRNKNANHPNSSAYFQFMKMNDNTLLNAGVYAFCEEDDQAVGQSGDAAFVLYGRVEGINKETLLAVKYDANAGLSTAAASTYWTGSPAVPTAAQQYWNGCALVVTDGAGKNNCWRIVRSYRYTDSLNDLFVYAVDRDPGRIFDIGTKMRSVPALYGLKRGQSSTLAAAHGDRSMVHLSRDTFARASIFEYFTADEDLTLAEVAAEIARKAGVREVDLSSRVPAAVNFFTGSLDVPARSQNFIMNLKVPGQNGVGTVRFRFLRGADPVVQLALEEYADGAGGLVVDAVDETSGLWGRAFSLRSDRPGWGEVRLSLFDGHVSVWVGGRLYGACRLPRSA